MKQYKLNKKAEIKNSNYVPYFEDNLYKKYKNLSCNVSNIFRNNETKNDSYHTWLFVGGTDMFSSFEILTTARTYVSHFEEDIRGMWTHPKPNEFSNNQYLHNYFQRYIFNLSKQNQNIESILNSWNKVQKLNPESIVYLVGVEDILGNGSIDKKNLKKYLNNLIQLIMKGLNLRNGNGYVFLQKHWSTNDNQKNLKIKIYNNLIDIAIDILNKLNSNYLNRISVINHYINTDNIEFKKNYLKNDDLNKYGHFEIGKQFATFTYKKAKNNQNEFIDINWGGKQKINPDINSYEVNLIGELQNSIITYDDDNALIIKDTNFHIKNFITKKTPKIKIVNNKNLISLKVEIDSNLQDLDLYYWIYFLDDKFSIEQNIKSKEKCFTIENILPNRKYLLKIFTKDGQQFPTIYGNTSVNSTLVKKLNNYKLESFQQKIQNKNGINWVVIGDSIPHAAAWTKGWEGGPVNFIRSLKQDYKRVDDVLINLSISGNTTTEEVDNINERLKKYYPDVLIIALGTNDVKNNKITKEEYAKNINHFIKQAKIINHNVTIFLSSILLSFGWMDYKKVEIFNNQLRKIANSNDNVIYVNLNGFFKKLLHERPYYYSKKDDLFYVKDGLHFSKEGQIFISKMWLKLFGFDINDSELDYISYIPIAINKYKNNEVVGILKTIDKQTYVDISQIKQLKEISTIVIKIKNIKTNQITTKIIERSCKHQKILLKLNGCEKFKITIHGYSKNEPTKYLFNIKNK